MKEVLYILGEFDDADADWLVKTGRQIDVPDGQAIIREGEPIDSLFFVTGGSFRVTTGAEGTEIARLQTGEVVGEISYVDRRPPTATVTAVEDARVLAIPRDRLTEKLEEDPRFASRFYKAVATFLADRLRSTLRELEGSDGATLDELDLDELHSFSRAGVRFERILKRLQEV
ncbi:MAG: cyclic nucleotide-binding domain-containing protein [Longimicrobiales bacterium]|nr:cyclic nucleotide-binding domain-containing protein [Longimicrobiales bacterium]